MNNPPRLAKRFLKWFVAPHLLEEIEGYETGFDGFNQNIERIALVVKNSLLNNQKNTSVNLMLPLYDELHDNYPEIKRVTRIDWGSPRKLVFKDRKYNKTGYFVDADFLKINSVAF